MCCCKAKEYEWCRNLDDVIEINGGETYCIFHAPKGQKKLDCREFNNRVFQRIDQTGDGALCDLSGTVFEGKIDFSHQYSTKINPLPNISFLCATFNGTANFRYTKFLDKADFSNAIFQGEEQSTADFLRAEFRTADFSGAVFKTNAIFSWTKFKEGARFIKTIFDRDVNFEEAGFINADFLGASFNSRADFRETTFEDVNFSAAIFYKTNYEGTKFYKRADFQEAIFNKVWFSEATFDGESSFIKTEFNGRTEFINTQFKKFTSFDRAKFRAHALFEGNMFYDERRKPVECQFTNVDISNDILLVDVILNKVSFEGTDLRKLDFINPSWPKICWLWPKIYLREAIYDEIKLRKYFYLKNRGKIRRVETLYRRLKQKYTEEHNEYQISKWNYNEKDMTRKKYLWRRFNPFSLANLYWITSGYSEKPIRALIMLFLFVFVISILFGWIGVLSSDNSSPLTFKKITENNGFDFKVLHKLILSVLQYITFDREPKFISETIIGIYLKVFARIIIPIQIALFAFSARNRFKR